MIQLETLHERWAADRAYQTYDALEHEFARATAINQARSRAGLAKLKFRRVFRPNQPALSYEAGCLH